LLTPGERSAFRRLGALPCRFPIGAAAAGLAGREGPTPAGAGPLRGAAALAYAGHELPAAGERDDALEGFVRYCTAEAALAAQGLVAPAQVEWLERVRHDLESYRTAMTWLIERGRPGEAADIAWGLKYFWLIR